MKTWTDPFFSSSRVETLYSARVYPQKLASNQRNEARKRVDGPGPVGVSKLGALWATNEQCSVPAVLVYSRTRISREFRDLVF